MWEPDRDKENLGFPKPEEFEHMTQEEWEIYNNELGLAPTRYEYARLDAQSERNRYIGTVIEKKDIEGFPTIKADYYLEYGWLKWGQPSKMGRKEYEELYKSCTHWSGQCESPIECILYDEVKKIELNPLINYALGDLLFDFKRDIAGRFTEGAAERYDQIYLTMDGDRPVPILIVECDGEQTHTKDEDIKKDAKKELNLNIHFPHVPFLRFTGSEIINSREKCAIIIKNTYDLLCSIYPYLKDNHDMVIQLRNTALKRLATRNI